MPRQLHPSTCAALLLVGGKGVAQLFGPLDLAKTLALPLPAEMQPMGKTHTCSGNLPTAALLMINNFTYTCICSKMKDTVPSAKALSSHHPPGRLFY